MPNGSSWLGTTEDTGMYMELGCLKMALYCQNYPNKIADKFKEINGLLNGNLHA